MIIDSIWLQVALGIGGLIFIYFYH